MDSILTWKEFSTKSGAEVIQLMLRSKEVVFDFPLIGGTLTIHKVDVAQLEQVLKETKLNTLDAKKTMSLFCSKAEEDGMLYFESFELCRLLPGTCNMDWLKQLFHSYDFHSVNGVMVDEFCTGFSLLCAGSKSSKLHLGFSLFEEITQQMVCLENILLDILICLFALTSETIPLGMILLVSLKSGKN